jgi:hypothetical protein
MSTTLWGEDDEVWEALREAFDQAVSRGAAVMAITLSNACPKPGGSNDESPQPRLWPHA